MSKCILFSIKILFILLVFLSKVDGVGEGGKK